MLSIAWLMSWGKWSLQVDATGSPAVSGVGVTQEGALAVDVNLRSELSKAQGKLWSYNFGGCKIRKKEKPKLTNV